MMSEPDLKVVGRSVPDLSGPRPPRGHRVRKGTEPDVVERVLFDHGKRLSPNRGSGFNDLAGIGCQDESHVW